MVVNVAIILAIIHYLVIPLVREIRQDVAPAEVVTTATLGQDGKQTISSEYGTN